jgi:DMSO/TMAO reductase YedYZ molybdopterin-dependent catalytic subunit
MTDRRIRLADDVAAREEIKRRSRRDFLLAGGAALAAVGGYSWMRSRPVEDGVPGPQRRVLDFNEKLAHGYLSDSRMTPMYSLKDVGHQKSNGQYGLDDDVDDDTYRLTVDPGAGAPSIELTIDQVKALPKVEQITKFCCIEGWSVVTQWTGVRFVDFTRKYFPSGRRLPAYVSMATPSQEYYVGLDAKSALHPQTLLAYEINGQPLGDEHGAPLRLVVPVKYGIKNIKRVASIQYTDQRPSDYWAEQGYDWFAGL